MAAPVSTIRLASLTRCHTFNPRNLKYDQYTMWLKKLLDLRGDLSQVLIQPQFCVWLSGAMMKELAAEEDQEGVVDIDDDDGDEDGDNPAANTSNVSDVLTLHEPNALMRLVDLAVLFLLAEQPISPSPTIPDRIYSTPRIKKVMVPVPLELKRAPSRKLAGQLLAKVLKTKIRAAKIQAVEQAQYLFTSSIYGPHQSQVTLVAAVGPYFSITTVSVDSVSPPTGRRQLQVEEGWSDIMDVTSVSGGNELEATRRTLLDLAKKYPFPSPVSSVSSQ
ncbi:hypothetical protein DFH07DRAFT_589927 [Mycena maculata]|uniref:Uncharacterized protein n=1 Tax=Mycena maculata TaxID=230809 RepID=A0AAD7IQ37_9AGAR|nr:hypothetical protein DFH07DRAFT_589927 [Mycena maculata]